MTGVILLLSLMFWIGMVWATVYFVARYALNRPKRRPSDGRS